MQESSETVACCESCRRPMNVSDVAPFTNVKCPACGEKTRVKRQFGPYSLVRRHAVGGMSMVFVAHDETLDREVALKILSEQFSADEKRIAAFEEEARITASFSHPHVVRVLTTGKAFGRFYIAMELVPGGHFEHQIRHRGKIPELDMLPLAIEVAEGLKAAHAAGLIHRDIKPGNILLDSENHAKIVDFGLALVTHGGQAKASEIWATPYYVPPETIEGAPEDFRADIYAFGATLYHALAGEPSCGEETMSTDLLRQAKRSVVPLGTRQPSLSVNTCRIVEKAMAYEPGQRFSSYDEMIALLKGALSRLQAGTAASVEAREAAVKLRAKKLRNERLVWTASGVVLCMALGFGTWWMARGAGESKKTAPVVIGRGDAVVPFTNPAEGTEVAKIYQSARAAVEAGEFDDAASAFTKLLENAAVQEPTRSWAGTEAVLANYLAGNPGEAVRHSREVLKHTQSVDKSQRMEGSLIRTLEQLPKLPSIPSKEIDRTRSDAGTVLAWMLAGLKDWDQGMIKESSVFFSAVSSANCRTDDAWVAVYQKIARNYLADREVLERPVFSSLPADGTGCESAVQELESVLGQLKTRGRARFNVRAWQLDIKRHSKRLSMANDASSNGGSGVSFAEKLRELSSQGKFEEISDVLRSPQDGMEEPGRASLQVLATACGQFLADLKGDLGKDPVKGEFALADGNAARQISVSQDGRIEVVTDTGSSRIVGWEDLPADTLIMLHRTLIRNPMSEPARTQRNERAIAYDWLAGDRDRALQAANQLSQYSEDFKQRWEKLLSALPQ